MPRNPVTSPSPTPSRPMSCDLTATAGLREELQRLAEDNDRARRRLDDILAALDGDIRFVGNPERDEPTRRSVAPPAGVEGAWPDSERLARISSALATLADLAHKINNPLTSLLGRAQILKLRLDTDPQLRKAADVVEESARRIADHVRELAGVVRDTRHEMARSSDGPHTPTPSDPR